MGVGGRGVVGVDPDPLSLTPLQWELSVVRDKRADADGVGQLPATRRVWAMARYQSSASGLPYFQAYQMNLQGALSGDEKSTSRFFRGGGGETEGERDLSRTHRAAFGVGQRPPSDNASRRAPGSGLHHFHRIKNRQNETKG